MTARVVISCGDTVSKLGITQMRTEVREILYAYTPCCNQTLARFTNPSRGTDHWGCSHCESQILFPSGMYTPPSSSAPVFEFDALWVPSQMITWIEEWTGLVYGQDIEIELTPPAK